jgi:TPR repeat protein
MASLPPAAAPQSGQPPEPPAPPPEPAMNAQEIDLLLNQGKQFIAVGDLATARTVLQRAADAGVAPAALALAETYDPAVLARQGVRGLNGDVAQARRWYARAQQLGSAEAARRLDAMAQP